MQDDALVVVHFDLGFGIDSRRQGEGGYEPRAEIPQPPIGAAELRVQRLPGDLGGVREVMQAIGEPTVDIQREGVVSELPYGGLIDPHRMAPELVEERLR